MQLNFFLCAAIAAIIPLLVGFIWYNPNVFGNAWMNSIGMDEAKMKEKFNPILVFGLCYVFAFLISFRCPVLSFTKWDFLVCCKIILQNLLP